jgi:hypothetical protein
MMRVADRLMAVLALAAGAGAFWMFSADPNAGEILALSDLPASAGARLVALLAGGAICIVSAWRLWAAADAADATPNAPLFGRGARPQREVRAPAMRPLLYAIPLIALGALVADRFAIHQTARELAVETSSEATETAVGDPQNENADTPHESATGPIDDPDQRPEVSPAGGSTPAGDAKPDPKETTAQSLFKELLNDPPAFPSEPTAAPDGATQAGDKPASAEPGNSNTNWIEEATRLAKPGPVPPGEGAGDQQMAMAPGSDPPEQAPAQTTAPPAQRPQVPTQSDGHSDAVVWLAISPDGRTLMSASTDRTVKLWDIAGKRLVRDLGVHKDMARTALFLPDGERALTCGDDGEIVLRNLEDGAVLHVFSGGEHGGANKVAVSPDGRRAVSVHETGTVIVWDIEKRAVEHVIAGHAWSISSVAISPDARLAVSGSIDGELNLWNLEDGKLIRRWLGHERGTYGAVFTPDSRQLVTGSGDMTIKVWDVETSREARRLAGHSGTVYALTLSVDGGRLASSSLDGTARLWNLASGEEVAQFSPGTGAIYSIAFAPDGSLLTGGVDRTIRKWPGGDVLFAGAPD